MADLAAAVPKVLMVAKRFPYPTTYGVDIRIASLMKALAKSAHLATFFLAGSTAGYPFDSNFTTVVNDPELVGPRSLRDLVRPTATGPEDPYSSMVSQRSEILFKEMLAAFQPDIVILERIEMAPYVKLVRSMCNAHVVLDIDESQAVFTRKLAALQSDRVRSIMLRKWEGMIDSYEESAISSADSIWVSGAHELNNFQELYGIPRGFHIVPNCIDVSHYMGDSLRTITPKSLIFTAQFQYEPNLDALGFLINDLLPELPDHTLELVGRGLPEWVAHELHPRVRPTGSVASVAEALGCASVALIPLRVGAGTRIKALEAMASGTPIVSTAIGVEGLAVTDGEHFLKAETAPEFSKAINALENDPLLRQQLISNSLNLVRTKYSVEALSCILEEILPHIHDSTSTGHCCIRDERP